MTSTVLPNGRFAARDERDVSQDPVRGLRPLLRNKSIGLAFTALFVVEWVRTAWISDDATITLRSVLNLLNGGGPNFNWGEHVDAFTDPAWFLLISVFALTGLNVFWVTLGLSLVLSIATLTIIWRYCSSSWIGATVAMSALLLSKAFVDYSSSGLENPLGAFLLVAIFASATRISSSRATVWFIAIGTGLLFLTRVDLLITVLPLLAILAHRHRRSWRRMLLVASVGAIPPVAWTAFSVVYYGFAVPNTAYAKLGSGVGKGALLLQGMKYILDSITRDPITLAFIVLGLVAIAAYGGALQRATGAGVLLYLLYVVWIGGDFMTGRFFMVPLVGIAAVVATLRVPAARLVPAAAFLGVLGLLGLPATLLSGSNYFNQAIASSGIADERGFWFQANGLTADGSPGYDYPDWTAPTTTTVGAVCGGLGRQGLEGGPSLHLIDTCGLADPLLARVPAISTPTWRIGHFVRDVPTDYRFSLEHDINAFSNPQLHRYYNALLEVTHSNDLFAPRRMQAIWDLNVGNLTPGSSYSKETTIYG